MRAVAFVPIALSVALGTVVVASCDDGGEPPGGADSSVDSPVDDVRGLDVQRKDSPVSDVSSDTPTPEASPACGTLDNDCCEADAGADAEPCSEGYCIGGKCQPACGFAGAACCIGSGLPCGTGEVCKTTATGNICAACGTPGNACCYLNYCDLGCCFDGYCVGAGAACAGTDGGTCQTNGSCGSCGGPGLPCCEVGCTAASTVCIGAVAAVDAGEAGVTPGNPGQCSSCGGAGQPCCSGSSCLPPEVVGDAGETIALACVSDTCEVCGGYGQPCCGTICGTGFMCGTSKTCQ